MANIHEITLDVKKSGQTINEPIVIRTDDTDDVIEVHVKKDGLPYTGMTAATFYGTKQDMTIIANDPATVNNDVITYSVPKELANIGGKIKNAYFMIDGKISTENFIITILKTVNFKGESKDYIPGLNNLIDKWNTTSKDWTTKLNGLDTDIKNLSTSEMLKEKMDKELETAKFDYMNSFNESVDKLNGVITDLNSKETSATDKGKELDSAINKVNQSIENVNSWLTSVQSQIISANNDFTESQKKSVTSEINVLKDTISTVQETANNLTKQLDDINDEIKAVDVPDLNAKVDTANSNASSANTTADSAIAKFESYYDKTEIDSKLGAYEKSADLTNLLKTYVLATQLSDLMTNYAKSDDVKSWIATSANQTKEYAAESIKAIVGAAPETLDTIAELATAVTDNKTIIDSINAAITNKAEKTELDKYDLKPESISSADYEARKTAGTLEDKFYITSD